jgi:hypothetical protein
VPSHHYTFFANAAVGQDIWRVETGIQLTRQLPLSNLYYQLYYGYAFQPRTEGYNTNYSHLYGELGYFVSPKLAIRGFATAKIGHGLQVNANLKQLTDNRTNDIWFYHDKESAHEYAGLGAGFDYQMNDRYGLSASVQRLVWGRSVFNFKYVYELRLTRGF